MACKNHVTFITKGFLLEQMEEGNQGCNWLI